MGLRSFLRWLSGSPDPSPSQTTPQMPSRTSPRADSMDAERELVRQERVARDQRLDAERQRLKRRRNNDDLTPGLIVGSMMNDPTPQYSEPVDHSPSQTFEGFHGGESGGAGGGGHFDSDSGSHDSDSHDSDSHDSGGDSGGGSDGGGGGSD